MTDFWSAAREGLHAHETYSEVEKIVRGVVAELSAQFERGSGGRLTVDWVMKHRDQRPQNLMERVSLQPPPQEAYRALVAKSANQGQELARLELGERGWPVDLKYVDIYESCYDREAIEKAIEQMLQHPRVGGALRALLGVDAPSGGGIAPGTPASPAV